MWWLAGCLLLSACAGAPRSRAPGRYAWDNTVDAACRANAANCGLAGKEAVKDPWIAVATAGSTVDEALQVLDTAMRERIEEALKECADEARSTVLLRYRQYFKGASPTPEDCMRSAQEVAGQRVNWAVYLGTQMHRVALQCTEERLNELRPSGFSLEPRYGYDRKTGRKRLIRPEEEQALERSGNSGELRGTLKPDVVLHRGDPLDVLAIYDYKFPCVNSDRRPSWNSYPAGHPYSNTSQGEMYEEALGVRPLRVAPRQGIIR